jgi:hypothetical protein
MKRNMSNVDRVVRTIIALVAAYLYFGNVVNATLGLVLLIGAVIFLATSLISFCPIYAIFGISSCKVKDA